MCGIAGILGLDSEKCPLDFAELVRIRDAMAMRGPDGSGLWVSQRGNVGLAHRRLAIIDLSDAGAQPMLSADGRFAIVFNGEIYNHRELRAELEAEGFRFRSKSDTEVLLALYEREGSGLLRRLRGMYALGIWDDRERRLFLARDPYGIKPLYYSTHGGVLRFASQVKALEAGGTIPAAVDPAGLVGFLLWGSVPEPFTLRREVRALPAGHFLEIVDGRVGRQQAHHRLGEGAVSDEPDVVAALDASVRAHLVSDVPVGIFLSAGLDSAILATLMRRHLAEPPLAFTLSFDEFLDTPLDEAPGAAALARSLGLSHVEKRVSRSELEVLWANSLEAMDQPSIDGFNVFMVSHYARKAGLKVVLSGLGGDELFGSYPSFRDVPAWRERAKFGRAVPGLSLAWGRAASFLGARWPKAPGFLRHGETLPGAYFLRRGLFLPEEITRMIDPQLVEQGFSAYDAKIDAAKTLYDRDIPDDWTAIQLMESTQYLRNQLLRDADWASMANSLELRVPFVDADLHRSFWRARFEPARTFGKAAIARLAAPEIPEDLRRRPKSGFMVPWAGRALGPKPESSAWGRNSRKAAVEVLRLFGVDVRAPAAQRWRGRRPNSPRPVRGGSLFLLTEAFRHPGGIQTFNRTLVQAVRHCVPDEPFSVVVLNDAPEDVLRPEWTGFSARGCSRSRVFFSLVSVRVARAQRPHRVILGHRHLLPLAPILRWASRLSELWLVVHGVEARPALCLLERLCLRSLTRVLAVSPQTAELFRESGCHKVATVLPNSLSPSWEIPDSAPPRLGATIRLLTVSRLVPRDRYKGIDVAIRAVGLLRAAGMDVALDVVGAGQDLDRLRAVARVESVEDVVVFHGQVSDGILRSLYAACDIFVLPSTHEGFGIVYLEAMAFAKPVIAADAAGAPFAVRPGISGVLVPPGDPVRLADAVRALVRDPEGARSLGTRGRQFLLDNFSFRQMTERVRREIDGGHSPGTSRLEGRMP
jgi:asparagine synthase (glutamine-hydrolysing)